MRRVWGSVWKFLRGLAAPRRLVPVCYVLAVLGWLAAGLYGLAYDRARPEMVLDIVDARTEQLELEEVGIAVWETSNPAMRLTPEIFWYRTTGGDPQLVFEGLDAEVRTVLLRAEFESDPGELDTYYTREAGQGFSAGRGVLGIPQAGGGTKPLFTLPGRRAVGRPVADGWLYTLPAGHVQDLRIDLGTQAGNVAKVGAVVLNPDLPVSHYLLPTARTLVMLAVGPALASCAVLTIIELVKALKRAVARRGKKGRAQPQTEV